MEDIKLKNGVYSVVNTTTGVVLSSATEREYARSLLRHEKSKSDSPKELKLAKMKLDKFIR